MLLGSAAVSTTASALIVVKIELLSKKTDSVPLIKILPALPVPEVEAEISVWLLTLICCAVMLILPASPEPIVSTAIFPCPLISIVSGAVRLISPPLPLAVVEAEIIAVSVNSISKLGLFSSG